MATWMSNKSDKFMPLHPVFVHFPVGLFIIAFVFEIVNFFSKGKFRNLPFALLSISLLFSIISVQTGNTEASNLNLTQEYAKVLSLHQESATLFLFISVAIFMLKLYIFFKFKNSSFPIFLILLLLYLFGSALIYRTVYFGMKLVFEYGIGLK